MSALLERLFSLTTYTTRGIELMSRQKDVRCASPILLSLPPTPLTMRSRGSRLMSRWARRSLALLIYLCSWSVASQSYAQPSGVVVPLKGSAGVEANVETSLNKGLRRIFSSKLKLIDGNSSVSISDPRLRDFECW